MAISFVWDSAFEAAPPNTITRSLIDDNIRLISRGLRERFEQEHNWGPYTDKDDGSHIPGETTVMLKGDEVTRDALANPQEGALYLVEDGAVLTLWIYTSGAWVEVGGADHQALSGLTDNDHPQYVLADGGVMSGNLDLGSSQLKTSGSSGGSYSGMVVHRHNSLGHPTLGSSAAVKDGDMGRAKLKMGSSSTSTIVNAGSYVIVSCGLYMFWPQVYILDDTLDEDVYLMGGIQTRGFGVWNGSASNYGVRLREEHLE